MAEFEPVQPPKKKATELEATLRRMVAAFLDVDESEVTDDSSFRDDLGADSLDCVEIVMMVEEDFHIDIDADAAERLRRFRDLVKAVEKRTGPKKKAGPKAAPEPDDQASDVPPPADDESSGDDFS